MSKNSHIGPRAREGPPAVKLRCADCDHVIAVCRARRLEFETDCPICDGYSCNWPTISTRLQEAGQPGRSQNRRARKQRQKSRHLAVKQGADGEPSGRSVKGQLLVDAVQHPAVLLPLAIAILAFVYLVLLAPILRGGLWTLSVLIASLSTAAAVLIARRRSLYTREYAERMQAMAKLRERKQTRIEEEQLGVRREALVTAFSAIDSTEGMKALTALIDEYEQLQVFLKSGDHTDPISVSPVPELVLETYRQGLSVLFDALSLMKASFYGAAQLKQKISELRKDIAATAVDEEQAERLQIKKDTLASNIQRLELLDKLRLRVDQLLYQAGRCEASLYQTRIELVTIETEHSETRVNAVIDTLQGTIRQVGEVQEELNSLGF